ncbi:MAG: PhoH family protein, partial [Akkermansiaceae bacterium]|nr:PhoH family protein [Akkermansiaceae bacterium]
MTDIKLEFDTPQFLHDLFANDLTNLSHLEKALEVEAVTRDGWLRLSGSEQAVTRARAVFQDLENAKRKGSTINSRDFMLAIDLAAKAGPIKITDLAEVQLVGSRGKAPVVPRTPAQLEYVRAIESNDVTFGLGPAGTGKTYLAMAMALTLLKQKVMKRIVLTRP